MKAANLGDGEGAWVVALCYELGEGVDKNEAKAAEWYWKALYRDSGIGKRCIEIRSRDLLNYRH